MGMKRLFSLLAVSFCMLAAMGQRVTFHHADSVYLKAVQSTISFERNGNGQFIQKVEGVHLPDDWREKVANGLTPFDTTCVTKPIDTNDSITFSDASDFFALPTKTCHVFDQQYVRIQLLCVNGLREYHDAGYSLNWRVVGEGEESEPITPYTWDWFATFQNDQCVVSAYFDTQRLTNQYINSDTEVKLEVSDEANAWCDTISVTIHPYPKWWGVAVCQPEGDLLEMKMRLAAPLGDLMPYEITYPDYMERLDDVVDGQDRTFRFKVAPNKSEQARIDSIRIKANDYHTDNPNIDYWYDIPFFQPGCNAPSFAEQKKALEAMYKSLDGDHWVNNENWLSDKPIQEWYGVNTCFTNAWTPYEIWGNYIVALSFGMNYEYGNLDSSTPNNLNGTLPPEFSALMEAPLGLFNMNNYAFARNKIHGDVPEAVSQHPNWQTIGWEVVQQNSERYEPEPQEGWNMETFNLKTKDAPVELFVEDTTAMVYDILKENELTFVIDLGLVDDRAMMVRARDGNSISDKWVNLYLDYCNKGLGMVAIIGDYFGEPFDDYANFVRQRQENENLPKGIKWARNSFGEAQNQMVGIANNMYLIDKTGKLRKYWLGNNCDDVTDNWFVAQADSVIRSILGGPDTHEPFVSSYYTSTDFSKDGEVVKLQAASVGDGIDIVFVGECYVDKDMDAGGLYELTMAQAMEQFFAEEPYTSLRNRFNVYAVKAVSTNEFFNPSVTQLAIGGNLDKAFEYARKAVGDRTDRLMVGVICKPGAIKGRSQTFMFVDDGSFVAWMFEGLEIDGVIPHEMGGHGIAFLLDEYIEPGYEDRWLSDGEKERLDADYAKYGEGANIDWRSNPSEVKWAHFINDPRYADEELGVYEGAYYVGHGCYRPTENSMMRYNDCGFNAPSREAIYKRVMKLSEGDSWTYDYETFVTLDAPAREAYKQHRASARAKSKSADDVQRPRINSPQPVIYKGTWRDAGKYGKIEYNIP